MTWDEVRAIVLALPGAEDGTSYGTPALKVKGKFLTRLRAEDGSIVVPLASIEEREALLDSAPGVYFFTDHYRDWPTVLARLEPAGPEHVTGLLTQAWLRIAPKRLVKAWDAEHRG